MRTYRNIWLWLVFPLMWSPTGVHAQPPLNLDEIRVVAPYQPTLSDAFMIQMNPRIDDTLHIPLKFTYQVLPGKLRLAYRPDPIIPARMRGEPIPRLYRGHIRGGYGTQSTPYFEGFFHSLRSNEHALGLQLRHLSSGGGIEGFGPSAFSDNEARVNASRFFRRNTLDASLGYTRNVLHYYGYDTGLPGFDSIPKADIRQHFNRASAGIGFGTNHTDSTRMRHQTKAEYLWLSDQYNANEHLARLGTEIGRPIAADPLGFASRQYFSLVAGGEFIRYTTPLDSVNIGIVRLEPKIWTDFGRFQLTLGIHTAFELDTVKYFRAYPVVNTTFDLIPGKLAIYAGVSGGVERNSLNSLSRENPFVHTIVNQNFMNIKSDISGGIRGAIGRSFSYHLGVSSASISNHPFFVNDTTFMQGNRFSVIYDDVRRLHVKGDLSLRLHERLSTRFSAGYFQYGLNTLTEAWHMPGLVFEWNFRYNMQDKIILSADVFSRDETLGRMYDPISGLEGVFINDAYLDANISLEYRYNKLLSVFLNFNNITNKPLARWTNYPSYGFNFLGGLTYSF